MGARVQFFRSNVIQSFAKTLLTGNQKLAPSKISHWKLCTLYEKILVDDWIINHVDMWGPTAQVGHGHGGPLHKSAMVVGAIGEFGNGFKKSVLVNKYSEIVLFRVSLGPVQAIVGSIVWCLGSSRLYRLDSFPKSAMDFRVILWPKWRIIVWWPKRRQDRCVTALENSSSVASAEYRLGSEAPVLPLCGNFSLKGDWKMGCSKGEIAFFIHFPRIQGMIRIFRFYIYLTREISDLFGKFIPYIGNGRSGGRKSEAW